MSLLIYLTAFLFQLPLHASNRLTIDSIAVIFGPAILAPRTSLAVSASINNQDSNTKRSQEGLKWLLDNWDDSLSQDLLDEEYNPLVAPDFETQGWSDSQTGEEDEARNGSSDEAKLQYMPSKTAELQTNSPAFSMVASPMVHSQTQQTAQTMESDFDRSPVPEGWGEAISPSEDAANLQRQMLLNKPRKSSFDIDPGFSSPTRSEFGLLPNKPLPSLAQNESEQDGLRLRTANPLPKPGQATEPSEAPPVNTSDTPRSLKSTKSSRSLRDEQSALPVGAEPITIPGGLPLPTSPGLESRTSYNAIPDVENSSSSGNSRAREISTEPPSESLTRIDSSNYTISARDSPSTRTSVALYSRKESLKSDEGRSQSSKWNTAGKNGPF